LGLSRKYESGLTWRSIFLLVLACALLQPILIYAWLQSGLLISGVEWILIIIASILAEIYMRPLSPAEIFIIWTFMTGATFGWFVSFGGFAFGTALYRYSGAFLFLGPIMNMYLANHPLTTEFGYRQYLPSWFAPPPSSPVSQGIFRSFLHPDMLLPITVFVVNGLCGLVVAISLGLLNYQIYTTVEKLDFPLQAAFSSGVYALSRKGNPRRALLIGAFLGFLWMVTQNIFMPQIPQIAGMIDFSPFLELLGLKGASLGINLLPVNVGLGWLISPQMIIVAFLSSFIIYFVGNHLLVKYDLWTTGIGRWLPGSGILYMKQWSDLRFWTSLLTGLFLAAALVPFIRHHTLLIQLFRSLSRVTKYGGGTITLKLVFGLYLAGAIGSSLLLLYLIPGFPLWLLIFLMIVWPFLGSLVACNIAGRSGIPATIPNFENNLLILSGWNTVDKTAAWFAPIYVSPWINGASTVMGGLFMAKQMRIRMDEYFKAYILVTLLSWAFSFIYVSLFWHSAPIPSSIYPYAMASWPQEVNTALLTLKWMQSGYFFRVPLVLAGFIVGAILYLIGDFTKLIFLLPGAILGLSNTIDLTVSWLIGAGINFFLRKVFAERWDSIKNNLFVGFGAGTGIWTALFTVYNLIIRSRWILPY